jgi:hypothetical protein
MTIPIIHHFIVLSLAQTNPTLAQSVIKEISADPNNAKNIIENFINQIKS